MHWHSYIKLADKKSQLFIFMVCTCQAYMYDMIFYNLKCNAEKKPMEYTLCMALTFYTKSQ